MSQPAARVGDAHACPASSGDTPHGGGPIAAGCPSVLIGGQPAARVGDPAVCKGPPDTIVSGSPSVLIGGAAAAHVSSTTAHGGVVTAGCSTVLVGTAAGGSLARVATSLSRTESASTGIARSAVISEVAPVVDPTRTFRREAPFELEARQFKVCRTRDPEDPDRTIQSIEEVERRPDGGWVAVGSVDPERGLGSRDDIRRYESPRPVSDAFPAISNLNGQLTSPDGMIRDASAVADRLVRRCPRHPRQACVLATYSATRGPVGDTVQSMFAKWNIAGDRVQQRQEAQMEDAIRSGRRITISAHSRGTIHTENAWRAVHDRTADRLLLQNGATYARDPSVAAAERAAHVGDRTGLGPELAARRAMRRLAEADAAEILNRHVSMIGSGNAVWFPHPLQETLSLVADDPEDGATGDVVTDWFGHDQNVGRVKVRRVPGDDSALKHSFTDLYAAEVADEHCRRLGDSPVGESS